MTPNDPHNMRKGVAAALAAYIAWGLMPIYFKLIAAVNAWEIIAHRIIWGVPVLLLFLLLRDGRKLWARLRVTRRQPPWISLALAVSFASYGLVRKRLDVGPMRGLMWEYFLAVTPALAFLGWRAAQGRMDFLAGPLSLDILLMLAGLLTVLPLIWFNMAAQRLTLILVGFIQYLAPSMTFLLAVFLWDEPFTQGHAVAFTCIWTALALVSIGPLRNRARVQPID